MNTMQALFDWFRHLVHYLMVRAFYLLEYITMCIGFGFGWRVKNSTLMRYNDYVNRTKQKFGNLNAQTQATCVNKLNHHTYLQVHRKYNWTEKKKRFLFLVRQFNLDINLILSTARLVITLWLFVYVCKCEFVRRYSISKYAQFNRSVSK